MQETEAPSCIFISLKDEHIPQGKSTYSAHLRKAAASEKRIVSCAAVLHSMQADLVSKLLFAYATQCRFGKIVFYIKYIFACACIEKGVFFFLLFEKE